MLVFNNKGRSTMHIILDEELGEFFDLLKLRWALFNPDKTLKVFAVPEASLLSYLPDTKYNIQNLPAEKFRVKEEEVISNEEYLEIQSGKQRSESIEQVSTDFEFDNKWGIDNMPSKTDYSKGKGPPNPQDVETIAGMQGGADLKGELSDELMNDMRQSVLMQGNDEEGAETKAAAITLADFKMLVVLGKGTFGKVFLAEFSKNKKLYAVKVIRKDILIEYN